MPLTEQQKEKVRLLREICLDREIVMSLLSKIDSGKDTDHLDREVDLTPVEISDIQSEIQSRINSIKTKISIL